MDFRIFQRAAEEVGVATWILIDWLFISSCVSTVQVMWLQDIPLTALLVTALHFCANSCCVGRYMMKGNYLSRSV